MGARILGALDAAMAATIKSNNTLVYRGGSMVLETKYSDGSAGADMVIERPVDRPGERRFDLQDSERSEYITLSESGDVKYFSWEGRQFGAARTMSVHAGVLVIGFDAVARDCVKKTLSESSKEAIRLYEQLQGFRDDPEFARLGFGPGGPYHSWLRTAKALHAGAGLATFQELGFLAGEVMQLGMEYMQVATSLNFHGTEIG